MARQRKLVFSLKNIIPTYLGLYSTDPFKWGGFFPPSSGAWEPTALTGAGFGFTPAHALTLLFKVLLETLWLRGLASAPKIMLCSSLKRLGEYTFLC
jgi:hypothetical protein